MNPVPARRRDRFRRVGSAGPFLTLFLATLGDQLLDNAVARRGFGLESAPEVSETIRGCVNDQTTSDSPDGHLLAGANARGSAQVSWQRQTTGGSDD